MADSEHPGAEKATGDDESEELRNGAAYLWREYQWFFIAALWLATLVLGYIGFHHHLGQEASPFRLLYLTLQLFVLESGDVVKGNLVATLEVARILAPVVAAYTALKALATVFYDQVQLVRLRFIKNHVVICGLGRVGTLLAMEYRKMGMSVVVVELDEGNDYIQQAKDRKIIVLIGDASDRVMLTKARIDVADYLVAGTGDDSLNAEIAWQARKLVENSRDDSLTCLIHISGSQIYSLLNEHPVMTMGGTGVFHLSPFNIRSIGARILLNEHPPFTWDTEEKERIDQPRIAILGLGRFGGAMIVEMAIRWRLFSPKTKLPLKIIDRIATERAGFLIHHFPIVDDICDLELLDIDFQGQEFREAEFLFENVELMPHTVYVCVDDEDIGLSAALTLDRVVNRNVNIILRTSHDRGLTRLVGSVKKAVNSHLVAFELFVKACKPDQIGCFSEKLAFQYHKGYIEDGRKKAGDREETSDGKPVETPKDDPALKEWNSLPDSLKLSNRRQADSTARILALAGFEMVPINRDSRECETVAEDDIERIAKLEHERFVADRIRDGWTDGPRDPGNKTSPYLVPWDLLDVETKDKDRNWARRLPQALANVGLKICALSEKKR